MPEESVAAEVVAALIERGWSVACGESLTAGLVCAQLATVPGSSSVLRGGVTAYQPQIKRDLLKVPDSAIDAGLVSCDVAVALAQGAAAALDAQVGIGTTGAAGPDSHDGAPAGSAWIAVSVAGSEPLAEHLQLAGDRQAVREQVAAAALTLAVTALAAH